MRHKAKNSPGEAWRWLAVAAAFALASSSAWATPMVNVGTIVLAANKAGQAIEITVTGGDAVQGMELYAQIGNATSGPVVQSCDILTGTIFAGNNEGLFGGSYVMPRRLYQGVVTAGGDVPASGRIATLTVDTTGMFNGTYSLSLTNDLEQRSTNFAGIPASLTDGWIIIRLPGDADGSGWVDQADYGAWYNHNAIVSGATWQEGEFTGDGMVDMRDYKVWFDHNGSGGSSSLVPEPATAVLSALGALAVVGRRRQGRVSRQGPRRLS